MPCRGACPVCRERIEIDARCRPTPVKRSSEWMLYVAAALVPYLFLMLVTWIAQK